MLCILCASFLFRLNGFRVAILRGCGFVIWVLYLCVLCGFVFACFLCACDGGYFVVLVLLGFVDDSFFVFGVVVICVFLVFSVYVIWGC